MIPLKNHDRRQVRRSPFECEECVHVGEMFELYVRLRVGDVRLRYRFPELETLAASNPSQGVANVSDHKLHFSTL